VILKLENYASYESERMIISRKLREVREGLDTALDVGQLKWAYDLCELLSDWKAFLQILKSVDYSQGSTYFAKFTELLTQ